MTAPAQPKLKSIGLLLVLIGALLAGLGFAYLLLTPKYYRAVTKIKLEKRGSLNNASSAMQNLDESELAPAECEMLRSNAFLDKVVLNLGLSKEWGRRYHQGALLSPDETRELLRRETDIHSIPNLSLIVINVTSEDRNETALIANEFARLYLDYRHGQGHGAVREKIVSLQKQWEEQSKKVLQAESKVQQIKLQLKREDETNGPVFYDSDNYSLLQAKRIDMESQTVQLRDQVGELKLLQPNDQRQVLSSLDTDTNSVLNASLIQLHKAKKLLAAAESDHGAESQEYKHALQTVDVLDKQINEQVAAIMKMKEADLAAREEALSAMEKELKKVRGPNQTDSYFLQNPAYARASGELKQLEQERDLLGKQMDDFQLDEVRPLVLTAELMGKAETPLRPISPDSRVVAGAVSGGGTLSLAGLGLLLLGLRQKKASQKG